MNQNTRGALVNKVMSGGLEAEDGEGRNEWGLSNDRGRRGARCGGEKI